MVTFNYCSRRNLEREGERRRAEEKKSPALQRKNQGTKKLQPSRDEPEDASSFARRLKDGAGPPPDSASRCLKYPPVQD